VSSGTEGMVSDLSDMAGPQSKRKAPNDLLNLLYIYRRSAASSRRGDSPTVSAGIVLANEASRGNV
jgi:hypothetical protein